jgi:hypothetical protein
VLVAAASGERTVCIPEQTVSGNIRICGDQSCGGATGCTVTYTTDVPTVTTVGADYRLQGTLTSISGTLSGALTPLACSFELGLARPIPFTAQFASSRPDCSANVQLSSSVDEDWSDITLGTNSFLCSQIANSLRGQLNDQLNAALTRTFDGLECSVCAPNCENSTACR